MTAPVTIAGGSVQAGVAEFAVDDGRDDLEARDASEADQRPDLGQISAYLRWRGGWR